MSHETRAEGPTRDEMLARLAVAEIRADGPDKATGRVRYVGDMRMPGMLHVAFLGSPVPHGRIRRLDAAAASALPGVHAVITGRDVEGRRFGRRLLDRPILAWDRVLFAGDRVAAVAAETREAAVEAIRRIELDIEELQPVLDVDDALRDDAPILHEAPGAYAYLGAMRPPVAHANIQGQSSVRRGAPDIEAVFAQAAHVFDQVFETPRQHHGYMEPHAALVWIDPDGVTHVATTNKGAFAFRQQMSVALDLPLERLVIHPGTIGGDFGGKGYCIDEYACYFLARATGRPVRSVMSYADELSAMNVRHAARMRLRTAVDAEGRITAHQARLLFDGGAYAGGKPSPQLTLQAGLATLSPYRIPDVDVTAITVYTNTMPGGSMRAPGMVQAVFAGESHIDTIARALGEDPIRFRRRHVASDGEVGAVGDHFREARGAEVLDAAERSMDWTRPLPRGEGRGLALSVRHVGGGVLSLKLRLHGTGRVEVLTGLPDQGGGQAEMIRRALAVAASISDQRISIIRLTTADAPVDPGVGGSKVTHLASRAAQDLAQQLRDWIDERLPRALPNAPPDATLRDDAIMDPATGRSLLGFDALAERLIGDGPPVELRATYDGSAHAPGEPGDYDYAACAVRVRVDEATGEIEILDAALIADVGTIINPTAHAGQIDGGFAFGLGAALMEEVVVDGGIVVGDTLAEVRIPAIGDVPPVRQVLLSTAIGPGAFGAKMAGELSNVPVPPAIANAVADAVGIRPTRLPMTAERIHAALAEQQSSSTTQS